VRSSIFSFSESPAGPWFRTWLTATALVVASLAGWEVTLRCLGYRPCVVDNMGLWSVQRDRVYGDHGQKAVVLLGDCRMQLDFVPRLLAQQFSGHRVVQLAVEGTSPVATLLDLAKDQRFDGLVICALDAGRLCEDQWPAQQAYVEHYHENYTLNEKLNRIVTAFLQQHLTCVHPLLRLDDILAAVIRTGHLPSPFYVQTYADRSRLADYSRVDVADSQQDQLDREHGLYDDRLLPGPEQWLEGVRKVDACVRAIQKRGGDVIFMQFPTTGEYLSYSELIFPKAEYWDAFAAQTTALCLHFQDVPELADFSCPDGVHLDRSDAPRFTQRVAKVLEDRGLFQESSCTVTCEEGGKEDHPCRCANRGKYVLTYQPCSCCPVRGPC
jgi:hypothetical protein